MCLLGVKQILDMGHEWALKDNIWFIYGLDGDSFFLHEDAENESLSEQIIGYFWDLFIFYFGCMFLNIILGF